MKDNVSSKADALFGELALKIGAITRAQLDEALEVQRRLDRRRPLGEILIELNYVTPADIDRILEEQRHLVVQVGSRAKATKEDNLFGKVAVRLGFCRAEKVGECLAIQEQLPQDRFMRLGDILVIKGYLTVEQVKKILDTQQGLILYCPQCDTQYNVVLFKPGSSIQCYRCGSPLQVPYRATTSEMDQILYFDEE